MHKSRVAQAAIRECKFEQLNHQPYSPDLAPSDYYLFRNLKSHLCGTRFRDDDELKAVTEAWFVDQIDDFYFKGIDCLKEKHWSKGGLYWKIMLKPSSNLWVKPRVLRIYWTPLVCQDFFLLHGLFYWQDLQESVKMMISESDDDKMRTQRRLETKVKVSSIYFEEWLGGSVRYAIRLETRRSWVQHPPRSATFFCGDWSWNIFYGHSLPSAESRRAVFSCWRKNVHNTG